MVSPALGRPLQRDAIYLAQLVLRAATHHRTEVLLLHPGIHISGLAIEVRPGLFGQSVAIPPVPPGSSYWTHYTCTVVAVSVTTLRAWLAGEHR